MPLRLAPPQSGPPTSSTPGTVPCTCAGVHHLPLGSPDKFCWTPEDVAAALDISVRSLTNLRSNDPSFPSPRMLGTLPRWTPQKVRAWLDEDGPAATATAANPQPTPDKPATTRLSARPGGASRRRTPIGGRRQNADDSVEQAGGADVAPEATTTPEEIWHV